MLWEILPRRMFGGQKFDNKWGFGRERPSVELILPEGRGVVTVRFKTCDQEMSSFEQGKLKGWWADEALPLEIWGRLIPRTLDLRGFGLYSDIPEQDWHFELQESKPEMKCYFVIFTMPDNEHNLPEGTIERAKGQMSAEEQDLRIWGKLKRLTGTVYKEFDREIHIIKPFNIPSDWPRWRALDYGGSAPTACVWFTLSPNEKMYAYREYYQGGGNIQIHSAAIIAASKGEVYQTSYIDPHAYDYSPASPTTVAQQYAALGLPFRPWPKMEMFGEKAAVERVKRRLENVQFVVFETCKNLINEFAAWKYNVDRYGNVLPSDSYSKKNNHALDCVKGFEATQPCFATQKFEMM